MPSFVIKTDGLEKTVKEMNALVKRQIPFAISRALNKTAKQTEVEERTSMLAVFDRPTQYVINSLRIFYATKSRLEATIRYKDKDDAGKGNPASNFLHPQVFGGQRKVKKFESALQRIGVLPKGLYITPGKYCPLDSYGNIPASFIVQILSYFQAFGEQGYRANITPERKEKLLQGTKKKRGFEYFVSYGKGTGGGRQHLPPGIYKRTSFAKWGSSIQPIMLFVKEPSYKKRFPFYETAQAVVEKNLMPNFTEALDEAIKSAK